MNFFWNTLFIICNWLPISLGYSFLLGRGRVLNWGPIGMAMAAAYGVYVPWYFTHNLFIGAVAGLLISSSIALLYAWLALRLPGDSFGVMSIAVHLTIYTIILNVPSLTRGALGIPNIVRPALLHSSMSIALLATFLAVLWIIIFHAVDRGPLGRQLTALGEQHWNAAALGISRPRVYVLAFLLLGAALWTDNLLFPLYLYRLDPAEYHFSSFIFLLMMVIAGRPGSVRGVTLAVICLVSLKEALRLLPLPGSILGPLRLILFGSILLTAVWLRRSAIFPPQRSL